MKQIDMHWLWNRIWWCFSQSLWQGIIQKLRNAWEESFKDFVTIYRIVWENFYKFRYKRQLRGLKIDHSELRNFNGVFIRNLFCWASAANFTIKFCFVGWISRSDLSQIKKCNKNLMRLPFCYKILIFFKSPIFL